MDGGLAAVANVLISAVEDATDSENPGLAFKIHKRIYAATFPFWIVQYKRYGSYAASFGLISGLYPSKLPTYSKMNLFQKTRLFLIYLSVSLAGLLVPTSFFELIKGKLYKWVRRKRK